ncbi:alpha/beta hydrolase [Agaricicola taiwanensis]|uniref:Alpha/beta hydrolase n=1 Tax=Agaricicola taiwanensis TaxID=591372 RepID=A0A8J2YJD8_9RHOB|nr:alpha/beta fold hydrolase [Agaricicola taiwanensis]GGE47920.1 alpha/beta hydrolase [Agaricicola taiwanensis]
MPDFLSHGHRLSYVTEGQGDPILLIHGFASNIDTNWRGPGWISALAQAGFQVVAFDHRGHGASEKVYDSALYTIETLASDALALLDHLGIDRADIMGYSMGARVSALMGIEHPDRVRSLILGGMGTRLFTGAPKSDEIAAALEAPSLADVTDDYARVFRRFADATGGDRAALAACIRAPRTPLEPERLATIKAPTLVAVGTEDVVSGPAQPLADAISGAEVLDIPGRDHNRAVGDKVFREGVLAFLARRP